jgi:hypothetical protein
MITDRFVGIPPPPAAPAETGGLEPIAAHRQHLSSDEEAPIRRCPRVFDAHHGGTTMPFRIALPHLSVRSTGAVRRGATLISVCVATAALADPSPDRPTMGVGKSGEGVMRQLMNWQTCFKRDGARDVTTILAACDRLADSPDLLPRQREFLARWRAKLMQGDQAQESKSETKSGPRIER